jgi:hypothetical protein
MLRQIRDALLCVFLGTVIALLLVSVPIFASQNALFNSTTGPLSGLTAVQTINNGMDSLNTCNSGASAPTNQLSGSPSAGNCWYNTSTGAVSYYDGANWLTVGYIDATNHLWTPVVGGNAATTVSSATTANLCGTSGASPIGAYLTISGTTTITGLGSNCVVGQMKVITFSGILTFTYNATSLIMPTSANITTAAGDVAIVVYLGSGNWKVVAYLPISGSALSSAGLNIGSSALGNSALGFGFAVNSQLHTSVGSSALTVALCVANSGSNTCNNASSSSPILLPFRDATAGNGDPTIVSLQASLSITINSGNTHGCVSSQMCRLWVYALDNSGTVQLCTYNTVSGTTILDLNDGLSQTSASGSNGGSSAQTLYCNGSAVSGPIIRLGYVDISESTAGTWSTNASFVQLFGPGIHKPGDVLQHLRNKNTTQANTTNTWTYSATPPGSTNGAVGVSQAIVPINAADLITVFGTAPCTNGSGNPGVNFLYNGTTTVDLRFQNFTGALGSNLLLPSAPVVSYEVIINSTSSITYSIYYTAITGTTYINQFDNNAGLTAATFAPPVINIEEIMV